MKKINLTKTRSSRNTPFSGMNHEDQVNAINKLFMECNTETCSYLKRELESKRRGYYRQDELKKRADSIDQILTYEELIEMLVESKLCCTYCQRKVMVFYPTVRDPLQWTLDRIDNNLAHTKDNTCISCLECNLQRRQRSYSGFMFTKSLKITRSN